MLRIHPRNVGIGLRTAQTQGRILVKGCRVAQINIIAATDHIIARLITNGDVIGSGFIVQQSIIAQSRIITARGIRLQCAVAVCGIVAAARIVE